MINHNGRLGAGLTRDGRSGTVIFILAGSKGCHGKKQTGREPGLARRPGSRRCGGTVYNPVDYICPKLVPVPHEFQKTSLFKGYNMSACAGFAVLPASVTMNKTPRDIII